MKSLPDGRVALPFSLLLFFLCTAALLWSSEAKAYAWMIRHDYNGCTPCHADPSGGGLLTQYGRAQGEILLRTHYSAQNPEEQEAGPAADFLWGAVKLPENLLLSGSFRELWMHNKVGFSPADKRFIQMQSDLRGQLTLGSFRANASLGYLHEFGQPAWITRRDKDNLVSREHWVGLDLAEQTFLLRAGRMNLPFGVRSIEHTLWVRQSTRTDINTAQQYGLSLAYSGTEFRGELMGIAGNFQLRPDDYRERGYSGFLEWNAASRLALGVSSLLTHAKVDTTLRTGLTRQAHGAYVRAAPLRPLVLLAEGDFLLQSPSEGDSTRGYAGMLQADLELIQGLHLIGTGEMLDSGAPGARTYWGGWGSVHWFFAPHADLRFDAVQRRIAFVDPAGQDAYINATTFMVQGHVYL